MPQEISAISIPTNKIDEPDFDSRVAKDPERLKALADSIKERGLDQPIKVFPKSDDRYSLVFGSRRLAAFKLNGEKEIPAIVVPPLSVTDQMVANGAENLQREGLSTFETARLCAALREKDMKLGDISKHLGLSKPRISNLVQCYVKLPPSIRDQWSRVTSLDPEGELSDDDKAIKAACSSQFLREIVQEETPDKVIARWKERVESEKSSTAEDGEADGEGEEEGEGGSARPKKSSYSVKRERYKAVLKALAAARSPKVAIDACRFLVGDIEKVRGLEIDLPE